MNLNRRKLLLTGVATWVLSACGQRPKFPALPPGSQVVAFGDSVTFGIGAAPGEDWPTQLEGLSGWKIHNAGVPGDTAEAGKERIQGVLAEHNPRLVIIEIGGNDFLRRRSPAAVKEDIRHLIRVSKAAGAQVVLIGVPELSLLAVVAGKPSDSDIYQVLSEEEGVPVLSNVFSDILGRPDLCADKIHPNGQGYQVLARGIFEGLRKLGF